MEVTGLTTMKAAPRGKSRLLRREWAWGYALIAPTIIGLCILNIYRSSIRSG
jgi:hypothetical protein